MIKKILSAAMVLFSFGPIYLFTQITDAKSAPPRIVRLEDRINEQRERIDRGLTAHTITAEQAQTCRALLDSVMRELRKGAPNKGAKRNLTKKVYEACNNELDANSSIIKEQKQYCYFYGPYVDNGPIYEYYDNQYPDSSGKPAVPRGEKTSPRIYELKDRLKAQRDRIKTELASNMLAQDGAKNCEHILDAASYQIQQDFKINGSHHLTRDQYAGLNAMLDANSAVLQESKRYFYYYDDPKYIHQYYEY